MPAAPEEYTTLREEWCKSGDGFWIVYGITSREPFQAVRSYWDEAKKNGLKMFGCLVGNKDDLDVQRVVRYEEGKSWRMSWGVFL